MFQVNAEGNDVRALEIETGELTDTRLRIQKILKMKVVACKVVWSVV